METPIQPKRKYVRKANPVVEPAVEPEVVPDEPVVKPKRKYVKKVKAVPVEAESVEVKKERKVNPWLEHVKAVKLKHADKTYKEVLSIAKDSYNK